MKTITKSAFLLTVTTMLISGCSTMDSKNLNQDSEMSAYMSAPEMGFMKTSEIAKSINATNRMIYLPEYGIISQPKVEIEHISKKEQNYIAQYYGL